MASGFFAQAVSDAGFAIRGVQQQQETDQQSQLRQQQIDMNKMSLMSQQKQNQAKSDVADYMKSQADEIASNVQNPLKMRDMYNNAATVAAKAGDFGLMEEMASLAQKQTVQYKEIVETKAKEKSAAQGELADAAFEFSAGDMQNPEAQSGLAKKAIAAGVDPTTIPSVTNPIKFQAWAKNMAIESKKGKSQAEAIATIRAKEEADSDRKQEIKNKQQDRLDKQKETADLRAQGWAKVDIERMRLAKERRADEVKLPAKEVQGDYEYIPDPNHTERYKDVPRMGAKGTVGYDYVQAGTRKLTAQETSGISRAIPSANEIIRQTKLALGFNASLNPFDRISSDSVLGALTKTGTNKMAPDEVLAYTKSIKGIGVEAASVLGSMGGRTPPLATMHELQDMASRESGMSKLVGAYGSALMTDLTRTYISSLPLAKTKINPDIQETLHNLDQFPRAEEIAALIRKNGSKADKKAMDKLESTAAQDKSAGTKAMTTPETAPPAGFTIN